jgi:hypothetical protein
MAAVSDSSPLILYGRIGRLDLIHAVFGDIFVPPAVWREVVIDGAGKSGASDVAQASWIHQRPLHNAGPLSRIRALHPGESEAIIVAAASEPPLAVFLTTAMHGKWPKTWGWSSSAAEDCSCWPRIKAISRRLHPFLQTCNRPDYFSEERRRTGSWSGPANSRLASGQPLARLTTPSGRTSSRRITSTGARSEGWRRLRGETSAARLGNGSASSFRSSRSP